MSEAIKEGPRRKYMDLTFWASNGLIYMEDQKDGEFVVLTADEAFQRAKMLAEEVSHCKYYDEAQNLLRGVEAIAECVKEAKAQGDPMDDQVRKEKAREIKRGRSKILLPSGEVPGAHEEYLKNIPLFRNNK